METFSKRYGFASVDEIEIAVRNDAPDGLRQYIVQLAYESGFKPPSKLRSVVCYLLKIAPDKTNWSEYPNIDDEVYELLSRCKWYNIYDLIERLMSIMHETPYSYNPDTFEQDLNEYFIENGIGWKVVNGILEMRGPESFEVVITNAQQIESKAGLITASKELHEAIADLSRRPNPDTTGAIQHAMASLECVAREATGNRKSTLGEIMKQSGEIIPRPLDQAVIKAWGFASEHGRHLKEGLEPTFNEAELIVGICAAVGSYLSKQIKI
ncbi:MAG: hypothetical protein P4L69_12170 [Desulfosporosinus sp.]|nr:hypothetical protein [Desulfosporosinus sp.]